MRRSVTGRVRGAERGLGRHASPTPRRAIGVVFLAAAALGALGGPAGAAPSGGPKPAPSHPGHARPSEAKAGDMVVLSGGVVVRRGEATGDVVVVHGSARVAGVVRGDVVVVDGPI